METRKRVWIAALCLLSAALLTIGLRQHVTHVQAATLPPHATLVPSSGPAAQLTNASLRATALRNAMLLDDEADATRVTGNQGKGRIVFPPVEQFTLTPPNPAQNITKTTVAVRFGTGAEKLPAQIPMILGTQHVTVQRSSDDPNTYVTRVNFNWQTFAREQELRKQAAANGKIVTVFQGRKVIRTEPMQFMEPAQIQGALQSHQPLELSPDMLTDGPVTIVPDHELMITAIPVVEDPNRTFDQCLPTTSPQNPNGAWTFDTLMRAIACSTGTNNCTQQAAENMLLSMLAAWQSTQTVNTFQIPPRGNIGTLGPNGTLFLSNWPIDTINSCTLNGQPSSCPSLPDAPVHLNAIVNRIDLGQNDPPFPAAGELRFVFGVTANASTNSGVCSNGGNQPFNIILEYNVPSTFNATQWADLWGALQDDGSFDPSYRAQLQAITDKVVTAGQCTNPAGAAVSCLAQIRTNEIVLATNGLWEQRQFQLPTVIVASNGPRLGMVPIAMTPDGSFNTEGQPRCVEPNCNTTGAMGNWINDFELQILQSQGALPVVPASFQGEPFLGGSAFNGLGVGASGNAFWADTVPLLSEQARVYFSVNTCNGCHGAEANTLFQQVVNRQAGTAGDKSSNLANFLLGCVPSSGICGSGTNAGPDNCGLGTPQQCALNVPGQELVTDPFTHNLQTPFGDILRRAGYLGGLLSNGSGSGGMLLPFLAHPVGVH